MSTEVATTAIAPVDTPVMETATLAVEEVAATPAVEEVSVPEVAPAAPLATPKRSPFGDLKNKFFAKTAATPVTVAAVEEPVKETEVAPVVVDETPKENEVPAETAAVETPVDETKESPKKVKGPDFLDKVKALFHSEPKPKKEKVVKEEAAPAEVAAVETAPVVEEAAAPAVVVVEEVATPVEAAVVPEVVVPEASTSETAPEDPAVKFDAATKTTETPKKEKDLVKLGRRLSAKFGAALSPKKKEPVVETPIVADEAPKIETAIEETPVVVVEETPAVVEAEAVKVEAPVVVAVVEEPKVEEVVAAVVEEKAKEPVVVAA